MRSLEIRTQGNLIKQNQKLASVSVLEQSTSVQCPEPSVQSVASESSVQGPESIVQSPAFNTCVQSPGIPVCPFSYQQIPELQTSKYGCLVGLNIKDGTRQRQGALMSNHCQISHR